MNIVDQFQTFTPTWESGDVSLTGDVTYALDVPSIGNGEITGRIARIGGDLKFAVKFTPGSTTTWASSPSIFGIGGLMLPPDGIWFVVPALAYDLTADRWYSGVARAIKQPNQSNPPPVSITCHFGTNGEPLHSTVPFTWAAGDVLVFGNAVEAYNL